MTPDSIEIRQITGTIGAEVIGLGSEDIGDDTAGLLRQAVTDNSVVCLRNQTRDPERHLEIARIFGTIKPPISVVKETLASDGFPEIGVISTDNGMAQTSDIWHHDGSFQPEPVAYTILNMQICPKVGGDTTWASQYASYAALSPALQAFLTQLTARHVAWGNADLYADHPVVIEHPRSLRKALFVNPLYTTRINELAKQESDSLLLLLERHSTQPEMCCRWNYEVGDIAIWDNHYVQHYAVGDYQWQPRRIHRIEIEGGAPSKIRQSEVTGPQ